MSTKNEKSTKPAHHSATRITKKESATMTKQAKIANALPNANVTAPEVAAAPATPAVSVSPPPAGASIPAPPTTYAPATPGEFKNVVPRQSELAALPQAIKDLGAFSDYAQILGAVAPPQAQVVQSFQIGGQWLTMRQATSNWDGYCVLQEGYAWQTIRAQIALLGPAFALATQADATLVTKYPGLAALLGAKKSIAQKGASTRRLNKEAQAKGELPTHGVVGKKRLRKAQKAALASGAQASPATPVTVAASEQPATVTPVVVAPAVTAPVTNGPAH